MKHIADIQSSVQVMVDLGAQDEHRYGALCIQHFHHFFFTVPSLPLLFIHIKDLSLISFDFQQDL